MMTRTFRSLLALSAPAIMLACGGNPDPATPAPASAPATQPPAAAAEQGLTDERVYELGRGYMDMIHAGEFDRLWERVSPAGKEAFGSFEAFRAEGANIVNELGAEILTVDESVQPARAGMRATKVYVRDGRYAGADDRTVRFIIGLMEDGTIAGISVRPAE